MPVKAAAATVVAADVNCATFAEWMTKAQTFAAAAAVPTAAAEVAYNDDIDAASAADSAPVRGYGTTHSPTCLRE